MLRSWQSLIFLFLVVHAEWQRLPACPDYKVCAIFTCDICEVDGKKQGDLNKIHGFLWARDSVCELGTYEGYYSRIDIEPTSRRKWNVAVETLHYEEYERGRSRQFLMIIGFYFGNASITFTTEDKAEFSWKKGGIIRSSFHNLTFGSYRVLNGFAYKNYTFEIEANGEELIDILGGVKELQFRKSGISEFEPLRDKRFAERLKQLPGCDDSELRRVCYDTCDEIHIFSTAPGALLNCSSRLWYHSPSKAGLIRQWHGVDSIKCHGGRWIANSTEDGYVKFDTSHDVQCSAMEPAKATTLLKIVLGVGIAGGLLLICIVMIFVCFFMRKCCFKRRTGYDENDETKKSSTKRSSSDKAHTPNTGKSNRPSADIEGLETERISKDKTTNREGNKILMDTKKWNETHGVASKPSTPAIYCPPPPMSANKPQEPKRAAAAAGPPLPKGFAYQTMA